MISPDTGWKRGRTLVVLAALLAGASALRAEDVPFTVAPAPWDTGTLGNHRAVVVVDAPGPVARAVLPWRRRDAAPERQEVIVTDAGGKRILNVTRGVLTRESGELWFEPASGAGTYFVYYRPFVVTGRSNYPTVVYPEPAKTATPEFVSLAASARALPARVVRFEAVDELNRFDPMEVIATRAEVEAFTALRRGAPYLVFPEDRAHPIRMTADLPLRWIRGGAPKGVAGEAARGEYFAFQLGVYALQPVTGLSVSFSPLTFPGGGSIPAARASCINTSGVDATGEPFTRTLDVAAGAVQAIWCGVDVPLGAAPGRYEGQVVLTAGSAPPTTVPVSLSVAPAVVTDGGASEPWKQTRLKWLNSTLAQQNDVIAPYTPLQVEGRTVHLLGRRVTLGPVGLPAAIQSLFTPEMTSIGSTVTEVLAAPADLVVERADGTRASWESAGPSFTETSPGTVRWRATASAGDLDLAVACSLEFDGFAACTMAVTARAEARLADIRLELPYARRAATYLMGLGQRGGSRPSRFDWTWDVATRNQDGAWIGSVNAGLFFSLRAENYVRPLNTNFYLQKPLHLPPSWGNAGRGGISIGERGDVVRVTAYSGRRTMKAGETLRFDVNLIVTPFHALDTDFQWRTRFYHRYAPVDEIAATGATAVNVHHATPVNPWINYPFIAHRELRAYVDEAHRKGLKVRIYNTIRELSNRAYELFPLRSLGYEVFPPGAGGGFSWLQEHLGGDYIAAWFVPEIQDAAIVNSGVSRWHNYYVEGMSWLARNVGIDGVYLDDVAFDRTTMKRIKRVLTEDGRPGILDLHSANQFNPRDGYVNSAVLYLEHFPYLDRLWFGEYFDYEHSSPGFWLTEVSGIPFGLMGEMLEGGGNPWRGMVYGMTSRMPWSEEADPRPLWKAWDEFGLSGSRMIGTWAETSPVKTGRDDVLATVYTRPGRAMVAVASWAEEDTHVRLAIDWNALGLDSARATISAPAIEGFQEERRFGPAEAIPVPRGKGWLLIVSDASEEARR